MAKQFKINILSPVRSIYQGEAVSLVAPIALGYVGVLADHAPFIAILKAGKISLTDQSGNVTTFPSTESGFLQILKNNVTLLLDR